MTWELLNHALVAKGNPKEFRNINEDDARVILKKEKRALFARWTSEFDERNESDWWYVLKDSPFDISELKSNWRYKINKGRKYFEVKAIEPSEYKQELYEVFVAALSAYPEKYRPNVDIDAFMKRIPEWKRYKTVYGAFSKDEGRLCGYMRVYKHDDMCYELSTLKSNPDYEKYQINAAIISYALEDMSDILASGGMFIDGERTIIHETSFQNYLESYFNFRKAYASLHIVYRPIVGMVVSVLYPFRRVIKKIDNIQFFREICSVLKMEEIRRTRENRMTQ